MARKTFGSYLKKTGFSLFIGRGGVSLQRQWIKQNINITNHSLKTYNYGLRNYRWLYRMRYLYWRMSLWRYFWRRKVCYWPQFLRRLWYLRRRMSLRCNRSWRIITIVAQNLRTWTHCSGSFFWYPHSILILPLHL
jgi:hypothetical protein